MTKLMALAIPILPGKTEQWRKFTNELNTTRKKEFDASRKSLEVRERTFFQSTPTGDLVLVTLEGENPKEAFRKLGQKNDEFTKWFTAQAKEIHGFDLSKEPPFPFPELIAETEPIGEHVHNL